jgi:succinate dehydrogenase/fumarate reductase flavoprotein subunit
VIVVAGAGMAGLVAAARLRELEIEPRVLEKGNRVGGSMFLSSGVIWRHRRFEAFRDECPDGDPGLQAAIFERLDERLDWLESLGAPVLARETGNPETVGRRFDPRRLTAALARRAGPIALDGALRDLDADTVILATGGFGALLARRLGVALRANPWSEGDGLALARDRGAAVTSGMEQFYGRVVPAPPAVVGEVDYVRAAQLYGQFAEVVDVDGTQFFAGEPSWSENDLAQAIARQPGGEAWYVVDAEAMAQSVRQRSVSDMIDVAEQLGGDVRRAASIAKLGVGLRAAGRLRCAPFTAVRVTVGVTHTIGGLLVDTDGRVLGEDGGTLGGLYAAGVDAGGVATGGYASGLAAALVLGCAAAEAVARSESV